MVTTLMRSYASTLINHASGSGQSTIINHSAIYIVSNVIYKQFTIQNMKATVK